MLVVLDPGFFREEGCTSADPQRRARAMQALLERLTEANRLLASGGAALVVAVTRAADGGREVVRWFDSVYQREARVIEQEAGRPVRQALDRLREHRKRGRTLAGVPLQGSMYGVAMMADWGPLGGSWREGLEQVLAASVVAAASEGSRVLFLGHRILGRNACDRSSDSVELVEVLRWRLTVAIQGAPTMVVPCVGNLRHLNVEWTRRMDERLPERNGPGLHPYCPPPRWRNSQTRVWGTQQGRPCWIDAQGQGWARPATGGGYHWDVYLTSQAAERIGLAQINVTRHGVLPGEGEAGDLHHVPKEKRARIKDRSGWACP